MNESPNIILVVASFSNNTKKQYLEKVNEYLKADGYKLLLVDQCGVRIETSCDQIVISKSVLKGKSTLNRRIENYKNNSLLAQAFRIDACHFRLNIHDAAIRIISQAEFFNDLITKLKPSLCIIWHQFNGTSMILTDLCKAKNIPYVYGHLGVLPGTVVFEPNGQMAESWVSLEKEKFCSLEVLPEDIEKATDYIRFVRKKKMDRKKQRLKCSVHEKIAQHRKRGRKVIFYAGQNDYRSGMLPRSLKNSHIHSPHYLSTIQALKHLEEISIKKNWGIIFKPHPNIESKYINKTNMFGDHIDMVIGANIFNCICQSDVTVTILSSVGYQSLIHGKPVLQLGNSQLSGMGCIYEISSREGIDILLEKAIDEGFADCQKVAWINHVARLLRYYLFAYDEDVEEIMGRGTDVSAEYLLGECRRQSEINDTNN